MSKTHRLKTWPTHFKEVKARRKKMELRLDDRNFQKNDFLALEEYDPKKGYSGQICCFKVPHILRGGEFGLLSGYVIMSLEPIDDILEILKILDIKGQDDIKEYLNNQK